MTKVHVTRFISHELSQLPRWTVAKQNRKRPTIRPLTKYFVLLVGGQVSQLVDHGTHVTEKKKTSWGSPRQ